MASRSTILSGTDPEHRFPADPPAYFRQFCETDIVTVSGSDPNIEEIDAVDARVTIREFHAVANVFGRKIIAHGIKKIEVVFKSGGVRYTISSCIPFCALVATDCIKEKVAGLKVIVEHVDFCQISTRSLSVSVVFVLIPTFHPGTDYNSIRCDIRLDSRDQTGIPPKLKSP